MLMQLMLSVPTDVSQLDVVMLTLTLVKWLMVILLLLYLVMAIMMTRQIGLMRATVVTPHTARLLFISHAHTLAVIILLLYFLLFL